MKINIDVTEEDVSHISKVLTVNKTLQSLYFANCVITDNGAKSLSSSLYKNNTLIVLSLHSNPMMSSDNVQHFLQLLSRH